MQKITFILLLLLAQTFLFSQENAEATTVDFTYLEFQEDRLLSTHDIQFELNIPEGFDRIDPLHHQAVFNEHPFNVSVAAIMKGDKLIIVHAEKVTDDSGFLDYSYMKPVTLHGHDFHMKENCLMINAQVLEGAKDVKYIHDNGFDFGKAIYLRQFFTNTADGNSEYVLSFGLRVKGCKSQYINDEFLDQFDKILEKSISLKRLN